MNRPFEMLHPRSGDGPADNKGSSIMNATLNPGMNDIRELTVDETDNVAGGNPILAFIAGYVATKVLDDALGDGFIKQIRKMAEEKKGSK